MNTIVKMCVFSILVVLYIEFISCFGGDWCINDPRRAGRNFDMFATYFIGGIMAFITYHFITGDEKTYYFVNENIGAGKT